MSVDERIASAVGRARLIWAVVMMVCLWAVLISMPLWYVIFMIPFGIASYGVLLFATFIFLRETVTQADLDADKEAEKLQMLHDKLKSGELVSGTDVFEFMHEAGLAEMSPVKKVSDEIVGYIAGNTIYEWVELMDPISNRVERFNYHSVARYSPQGIALLPEEKDKFFAHVEGAVYARDLQPAQKSV